MALVSPVRAAGPRACASAVGFLVSRLAILFISGVGRRPLIGHAPAPVNVLGDAAVV